MVRGDSQQPRAELGFLAKLAQVLDHAQERLLGNLLGILVLLDDLPRNTVDLSLVFYEQRLHGREITRLGPLHQRPILIPLGFPLLAQQAAQSLVECWRKFEMFLGLVEMDRLPNVVDDDLARIAPFWGAFDPVDGRIEHPRMTTG